MANNKNKKSELEKTSQICEQMQDILLRTKSVETVLGYDEDGKRNGNGLITLIERIEKGQSDMWMRIDMLKKEIAGVEYNLNKISENWKDLSYEIRSLNENIKNMEQKIKSFESKIEEHAKVIDKSITPNKLRDVAKDFGIFIGFLSGLGILFGLIAYLHNKIKGI